MKLTAKYNLKKGLVMGLLAALPMFNACEKPDPAPEPTPVTPTDTTTPVTPVVQKHNVELVYENGQYQNIAMDTIRKYNADETVDTIFMVPRYYNDFSTDQTQSLQGLVNRLRDRHNVNPAKVRGKGELQLNSASVADNYEIVRFFRDTLGYDVTYYVAKSR